MQKSMHWMICVLLGTIMCVSADESEIKVAQQNEAAAALPEREFDIPKLKIGAGGAKYALGSNVTLLCSVSLPIVTGIDVQICHVKENGDLVLMASCHVQTNAQGHAGITLGPPFGQWRAGRAVVLLQLNSWQQSHEQMEVSFVGQNVDQEFLVKPAKKATLVCDVSKNAEFKTVVDAGQRFLVRGMLQVEDANDAILGPPVTVEFYEPRIDAAGQPGRSIARYDLSPSIRGKNGYFGFEVEAMAPEVAQNFLLRIQPIAGKVIDARKSSDFVERIITVRSPMKP